jgi:hypothetical protein
MDQSAPPNVVSTLKDAQNEIVYQIVAYRRVTGEELVRAVQTGLSQRKERPKRGQTITFVTAIR